MTDSEKRPSYKPLFGSYPGGKLREHDLDPTGLSQIPFGKAMRAEFGIHPDTVLLNHGSYGTVPKRVLELQHKYNAEREEHPDLWYRIKARGYLDKTRMAVASKINAQPDNLVLVDNATTGINCSLRAFPLKAGDAILDSTHTYGAIRLLCEDFTSRTRPDVERVHLALTLPITSEDDIIAAYESILDKHPNIRLAIVDHVTSPSAIVMPVARLCRLLHSKGVTVIVDGAHSFGQFDLDMEAIGADVYISNIHKWSYSPRGVALLWFSDESKAWARPPNTSWLVADSLDAQFFDQGTRDHVPGICARHAIQFYDAIGGMEKIMNYTSKLAEEGKQLLQTAGLEPFAIPASMEAPNMKFLKLPSMSKYPYSLENTWVLHHDMFAKTNIFAITIPFDGCFWIRISAQVYNDIEEMKTLADIVRDFIEQNRN